MNNISLELPIVENNIVENNIETINIKSRRYLGNKFKLLEFIKEVIDENINEYNSFCDIFAGTGVVGEYFNRKEVKIVSNDILKSNFVSLKTWLETTSQDIELDKLKKIIENLNSSFSFNEDYITKEFGDKYFSKKNSLKIDYIRNFIETSEDLNHNEKNFLLTSLIYAMDKVANTCGHYDAYRKKLDSFKDLKLFIPEISYENNLNNEVYNEDANELIKKIKVDILYLDPPYNSRQYSDAYHLLENITEWNKPEVFGVAKKMDRSHIKSDYNSSRAEKAFADLIEKAKVKYILFSYNTTENKLNHRSNAKLSTDFIIKTLKKKGDLKIYEKDFSQFTTGKTKIENHKERIYFVKVKK